MDRTKIDFFISTTGEMSIRLRAMGFATFGSVAEYVRLLPYGRVQGTSASAVLDQRKGTCSSKHALLATVALEADRDDIELMLGIFEMNERNTPGVGEVLTSRGLACVPEAHCYLRVNGERLDFTGIPSGLESPFETLRSEDRIDPWTVIDAKPHYHRAFIQRWSKEHGLDPDHVWQAREECIQQLARQAG